MIRKILLLIALGVFIILAYLSNKTPGNNFEKPNSTFISPTPTTALINIENWQVYESPKYGYSFRYSEDWYLLPYDETNPSITIGTHSLMNYDPNAIIKFMDHGIVDWKNFVGDRIIVKADITATDLGDQSFDGYIKENFGNATLQPSPDLKFGELETVQYNAPSAIDDQLIRTYIAALNDKTIIWANVFIYNQPADVILQDSEEWKEFVMIFATFTSDNSD